MDHLKVLAYKLVFFSLAVFIVYRISGIPDAKHAAQRWPGFSQPNPRP